MCPVNTSFRTLNPLLIATAATWESSSNKTTSYKAEHGILQTDRYLGSPMQQVFENQQPVKQCLLKLPADAHAAYQERLADEMAAAQQI